jgi:hypothetical protein
MQSRKTPAAVISMPATPQVDHIRKLHAATRAFNKALQMLDAPDAEWQPQRAADQLNKALQMLGAA